MKMSSKPCKFAGKKFASAKFLWTSLMPNFSGVVDSLKVVLKLTLATIQGSSKTNFLFQCAAKNRFSGLGKGVIPVCSIPSSSIADVSYNWVQVVQNKNLDVLNRSFLITSWEELITSWENVPLAGCEAAPFPVSFASVRTVFCTISAQSTHNELPVMSGITVFPGSQI